MKTSNKPFYKRPVFWTTLIPILLVSAVVIYLLVTILNSGPLLKKPDQQNKPSITVTDPAATTEATLPPPPSNPYGPEDFIMDGDKVTLKTGTAVMGIDVSTWQGNINWEKVKTAGVDFVMIRLGYRGTSVGSVFADDTAVKNYEGATKAGIKVGGYFFSQAITEEEAIEEANFVLDMIKDWDIQMPIVFDWEFMGEDARTYQMDARLLTDCTKAFCDTIRDAGYDPMIYFNVNQGNKLLFLEELVEYKFWLAMYESEMVYPYKIDMWQYTQTGSVSGIAGDVDMNIFFTYEQAPASEEAE